MPQEKKKLTYEEMEKELAEVKEDLEETADWLMQAEDQVADLRMELTQEKEQSELGTKFRSFSAEFLQIPFLLGPNPFRHQKGIPRKPVEGTSRNAGCTRTSTYVFLRRS